MASSSKFLQTLNTSPQFLIVWTTDLEMLAAEIEMEIILTYQISNLLFLASHWAFRESIVAMLEFQQLKYLEISYGHSSLFNNKDDLQSSSFSPSQTLELSTNVS